MKKESSKQSKYDSKSYQKFTSKAEAHKAFNLLKGIVEGIYIDKKINEAEIQELDNWCIEYEHLSHLNPFDDLVVNIQMIINDNVVDIEEIEGMKWLCDKFSEGISYYDVFTSDLQILQGICHGIIADGKIKDEEVTNLKKWLDENEHLNSFYPYDEIYSLLLDVLEDNKIDEIERKLLLKYFSEFTQLSNRELQQEINDTTKDIKISGICAVAPEVSFEGKQFCFTGVSSNSTRTEIAKKIKEKGGKYVNSVSSKTDYLIVGDNGNQCWAYACYGRKVEKAITLRKESQKVMIINEIDFWDELE